MSEPLALAVMGILFAATLVRATFGFGEALVAVPLLAMIMPMEQAAPLAVLASITVASLILLRDWRKVHFRSAGRLLAATLIGIPAGLWILRTLPEALVKGALAIVILGFSAHSLRNRQWFTLHNDRWSWLFGFLAGVMGGAYGMNGPPLVVYGSMRRWDPAFFRATLQAYFLPAGIAGMGGYWLAGLWTPAVTEHYLASLPAVVAAVVGGSLLHERLSPHRFHVYVYTVLAAIGAMLLLQALRKGAA